METPRPSIAAFETKDASLPPASRMSPVGYWVNDKMDRCYQLMETENHALLDQWMANWSDLADFEVHPVISSNQAAERISPQL